MPKIATSLLLATLFTLLGCAGATSAAAQAASSPALPPINQADKKSLLDEHNRVRADVEVGPVVWSDELASYAAAWADNLAATGCKMQHRPHNGEWKQVHGENLFMGTAGYFGVVDAVKSWESEKKDYSGGKLTPSNWYPAGHYTQVVWRNTSKIGCAKIVCKGNLIVVCNYDPGGNVMGQKPY